MKCYLKIWLFFLAFCFSHSLVKGQNPQYSIRGGLNLATTGGEVYTQSQIIPGAHLGFFYAISISDNLKVEPGLSYSLKGAKNSESNQLATFHLHYLDLPLNLRINLLKNLELFTGPQFSYLVGSRAKIVSQGKTLFINGTEGNSRFDFGLRLGAAYELSKALSLGIAHEWGFISLDREGDVKIYNRIFKITLGYNLN